MGRWSYSWVRGGIRAKFYNSVADQLRGLLIETGGDDADVRTGILERIKRLTGRATNTEGLERIKIEQQIEGEIDKLWTLNEVRDEKGNTIYTFADKIRKMYNDYEDLVFWLSINSNERVIDVERMSHGRRIAFQQRLVRHIQNQNRGKKGGETEDA